MVSKIKTHYRTCNICEALCGIEIKYENEKVISIIGDKKDPLSRGHICPKAVSLQDTYFDADRLTKIQAIQEKYGNNSVAVFVGNPNAHDMGNTLFMRPFIKALRTKTVFSASTVDQMPHHVAGIHMLGHPSLMPVPDLDRTNYLLIMGANPILILKRD